MGKLSLIFVSFAFFATSASAGNSCLETFSENPAKQHPAIQDLKSAQKWLGQAERVSHINEGLHGLVVSANRILDAAIENIVMINFSNLSASQKTKRGKLTEVLIEELQHSFGISDELMKMVISQRVSREVEYHQSVQAKQQSR